jgi:hypothetical protein
VLDSAHWTHAQCIRWAHLNLRLLRSRMFCANVGPKFSIALLLVFPDHLVERNSRRQSRRIEYPCAFRTAPTPKTVLFNPNQLAVHSSPPHTLRFAVAALLGAPAKCGRLLVADHSRLSDIQHWREFLFQSAAILIRGHPQTDESLRSIHKRIFRASCGSQSSPRLAHTPEFPFSAAPPPPRLPWTGPYPSSSR